MTNHVGLFGRQAAIDLSVPQWVTLYVSRSVSTSCETLLNLVEGVATVGSLGITLILDREFAEWQSRSLIAPIYRLLDFIKQSRPYFRLVICNPHAAADSSNPTNAGARMLLCLAADTLQLPHGFTDENVVGLELDTRLVFKTRHPVRLLAESAIATLEHPDDLPHWNDRLSRGLLSSTHTLLALNVLCKPNRFADGLVFSAAAYADEVVARAVNERRIKPRWVKPA